ncbi:FxsA family protein [Rhizobium lentis]|uniref:Membrane protein FxsA n=1 Tax=Rhizobium lentis TaxID=1138194 RepID=A0A9Q3MCM8_9HYPH|nr:FxsA family protein [Rhizobium lentis]MBX5013279.1 membrane protein FxsA [Rhizobium lentis]MBX5025890.1 membrane protein FxsA [Rhizobium lentis]
MRFSILPAFILLLPLGEIAGFVVVGRAIGLALTLALVMASFILGVVLLRRQGIGILRRMSSEGRNGVMPGRDLLKPVMTVIAALLLIIPGFLTDIVAILILLPPVREFIWRAIAKRFVVVNAKGGFSAGPKPDFRDRNPNSKVVDLDEEDYHREPDRKSPWSGKHLGD